jgi:hypothetical protein
MEENINQRLHSVVLSESNESKGSKETHESKINNDVTKKSFVCCFSNKWWFDHSSPAGYKNYDENDCLCCACLDCCTWCLEFQQKKSKCCKNDVVCFMCCCSITFQ